MEIPTTAIPPVGPSHSTVQALTASSREADTRKAVREIAAMTEANHGELTAIFVSPIHDLATAAQELAHCGSRVTIACTTAGEIHGPVGYGENTIVAASLRGVATTLLEIPNLATFDDAAAADLARRAEAFLRSTTPDESVFGIVLLDGMSLREEWVVSRLHAALGGIPIVGGSAGDALRFHQTKVLVDGSFRTNAGAVALVRTATPTSVFMSHHFEPTGRRLVVTAADPARRRVLEFDGMPAGIAYRIAIDAVGKELTPERLAVHPLILGIGGQSFVRSLAKESDDNVLELYCAIEEGLVLQTGRPTDIVASIQKTMQEIRSSVGTPELVLGFDCILRRLEIQHFNLAARVHDAMIDVPLAGFSTYGEVYGGLHVNQTLTGIAFGR